VEWSLHIIIKEMKIYDNFLPDQIFQMLFNNMKRPEFKWHMSTILDETEDNYLTNVQLVHSFYERHFLSHETLQLLFPIFQRLNPVALIKIKANLNMPSEKIVEHGLHNDIEDGTHMDYINTAVFYLNTNNGYTMFEDGTKVNSVQNRIVIFDNEIKHTGTTCTDAPYRMVINFNYVQDPNWHIELPTTDIRGIVPK